MFQRVALYVWVHVEHFEMSNIQIDYMGRKSWLTRKDDKPIKFSSITNRDS